MSNSNAFKQQLLELERGLSERRGRIDQHGRDAVPADFAEQAVVRANDEVVESLARQIDTELAKIKVALSRMEHGTYGKCAQCGEAISVARLTAVPYATACSHCAE